MQKPSFQILKFCSMEIDIPRSLSEINVPIGCARRVSEKALLDSAAKTNPRPADSSEIEQLIKTAIIEAR